MREQADAEFYDHPAEFAGRLSFGGLVVQSRVLRDSHTTSLANRFLGQVIDVERRHGWTRPRFVITFIGCIDDGGIVGLDILLQRSRLATAGDRFARIVNRFDVSVAVEVVAQKYFFHMPFYRQQDMFAVTGGSDPQWCDW